MATCRNIGIVRTLAAGLLVAALAACGKLDEAVTRAQDAIVKALLNQGIYERGNLPTDPTPT
ncbi:MAG: hypothetical protein LBV18_02575, partial [Alistipes sp.]|nr:hypothetical protein [Alistipes sp.]